MKIIPPSLLAATCCLLLLTVGCETTSTGSNSTSNSTPLTFTGWEDGNALFRNASGQEVMFFGEHKPWPFKAGKKYIVSAKRKQVREEVGLDVLWSEVVVIDSYQAVN
jgi:hypothetical protein